MEDGLKSLPSMQFLAYNFGHHDAAVPELPLTVKPPVTGSKHGSFIRLGEDTVQGRKYCNEVESTATDGSVKHAMSQCRV